jgi:hypothetical protein
MINKILKFAGFLMVLFLIANCSEDSDCLCPEPGDSPGVIGTYPEEGTVDVPTDTFLTVVFDKMMDPASISSGSITLEGPGGLVNAIVAFDSNSTATLTPLERLAGHSVYTARVDAGVRDVNGQRMDVPYAWSFTTGTTLIFLFPDIEFTIRDENGDGNPDTLVGGGPPGGLLQGGVVGSQVDRAVIEFPLDQIVHDEVIDAVAFIEISSTTVQSGIGRIESWGFVGNGTGEISDWNIGSRTAAYDDLEFNAGMTIALPILDVINAALDSSATHVGLRIVVTGEPFVGIATSGGSTDDDKARIALTY